MNVLVVTCSMFGNTELVAGAIADALRETASVRIDSLKRLAESDLSRLDLVVMGCPTHRMNLPEAIQPILAALPRRFLRGTATAAFDTSYRMSSFLARFTAAKKLDRKLRKLGGRRIITPETFFVTGREGLLDDGELERAAAWAKVIINRIEG